MAASVQEKRVVAKEYPQSWQLDRTRDPREAWYTFSEQGTIASRRKEGKKVKVDGPVVVRRLNSCDLLRLDSVMMLY